MVRRQTGFTLIELIMVILILGILAATAIPKFVDIEGEAEDAAVQGMAGALGSGSAINFAVRKLDGTKGEAVGDCQDIANTLEGGLDSDYSITAKTISDGASTSCTVTHDPSGKTATFTGHGIS